jgi:hypothetical protein|tara:strand:+ start:25 stop:342 length:318 start_codon:yes stop_codon:yes gene_type:complete
MEEMMLKEKNDNKCRSAIQLMIDSKKRGKQLQLLAGWNTWKHFMIDHRKSEFSNLIRAKDAKGGGERAKRSEAIYCERALMKTRILAMNPAKWLIDIIYNGYVHY